MRFPALLVPLALAAQAPAPPDNLCAISGTVVNAITAEPVRRALIALRRIDSSPGVTNVHVTNAVSTDSTGHFAISGIEPGTYRITAEHNGFLPAQYGARGPSKTGTSLVLSRGQDSTGLRISLYPHA